MVRIINEVQQNIILYSNTIVDALKQLDMQTIKVLFVVDDSNKLIASLTDGDIRRAILSGKSIDTSVIDAAFKNPIVADKEVSIEKIEQIMSQKSIGAIPVIDDHGRIESLFCKGYVMPKFEVLENIPVVIMAGGKGTRLYPYTKILPKPLIPVADTPICERIIDTFSSVGSKDFYMVVNYKKNMIKSYFSDSEMKCNLKFIDEDKPLGTGGGLKLLENSIDSTFVLTNCDILILEDLKSIVDHHMKEKNDVTMVCSLKNFEIPYGVVKFAEGGEIEAFEEKPKMNFFTNTGYYIVEPSVFDYIGEEEVVGMPDVIMRMKLDGKKVGIYPISENSWLDMGQFDSMEGMERKIRELGV